MVHLPTGRRTLCSHIIWMLIRHLAISQIFVMLARPLNKRVSAMIYTTSVHPMFHYLHASTYRQVI